MAKEKGFLLGESRSENRGEVYLAHGKGFDGEVFYE